MGKFTFSKSLNSNNYVLLNYEANFLSCCILKSLLQFCNIYFSIQNYESKKKMLLNIHICHVQKKTCKNMNYKMSNF